MSRLCAGFFIPLAVVGALFLAACNPSLNWREVRQKDGPMLALMPCKPEASSRTVNLGGQEVLMNLNNCNAAGATFLVGTANVQTTDTALARQHWQQAVLANISVPTVNAGAKTRDIAIAGVPAVQHVVSVTGKRAGGEAVQFAGLWFAQGTQVFHAAIYAERLGTDALPADMVEPFFNGLKLQ